MTITFANLSKGKGAPVPLLTHNSTKDRFLFPDILSQKGKSQNKLVRSPYWYFST
jgi:hypothetical protein